MSARVLGLVLAGGQSSRFGSDKALATIGGRTLLDLAIAQLSAWCERVAVAGRDAAPVPVLADWPRAGLGPLGGIAAGLLHARTEGFDGVLTCGVDTVGLPDDLYERLSPAPAFVESQPVVGLWPVSALDRIEEMLGGEGRRSMLAFAAASGARPVRLPREPANINRPSDLAEVERLHGI